MPSFVLKISTPLPLIEIVDGAMAGVLVDGEAMGAGALDVGEADGTVAPDVAAQPVSAKATATARITALTSPLYISGSLDYGSFCLVPISIGVAALVDASVRFPRPHMTVVQAERADGQCSPR